jgi:RNA polymerase sigma-70 factor (sigma-E family)
VRLYSVATKRSTVVSGIERVERGERSGLADLYVHHAPDGIRLAFLLTGDRALAEDLVQEAFARFVGRLGHLRNPDAFGSYLRRTLVNLSRSHFRRRTVERAYLNGVAASLDRDPTPDNDLDERIHEALLRLPDRQRAALVLRFYEDLPEGQTAEILRCRPGTVRSLVSRGMKALRSELGVETS